MNVAPPIRLYAYVDESGQETEGRLFIVSVVVVGTEQDDILRQLEAIETRSGKSTRKWHRSRPAFRQAYIDELVNLTRLSGSIFFTMFRQTQEYTASTADATARAITARAQGAYKITVLVDGLRKTERRIFTRYLRALHIRPHKVRGILKEENNSLIRLADALCGLIRDVDDGWPWAVEALARLQRRNLATQV